MTAQNIVDENPRSLWSSSGWCRNYWDKASPSQQSPNKPASKGSPSTAYNQDRNNSLTRCKRGIQWKSPNALLSEYRMISTFRNIFGQIFAGQDSIPLVHPLPTNGNHYRQSE